MPPRAHGNSGASGHPHDGIPCAGLRELQVMSARMDAELQETRAYQAKQNGTTQRIDVKVDKLDEKLDLSVKDRQTQLDSVQKQISNNHTAILDRLSSRDRQMLMLFVGIVVVMRAPDIKALGDALIKMFGGG